MNKFLKGGRGLPLGQGYYCLIKQNRLLRREAPRNDEGWRSVVLLIIFCVLFSGLLVSPAWAQEAKSLNKIQPLRIGDEVPDSLWYYKMPLYKGVNITDSLSLADLGGDDKVLIIDFWPFWCAPCIKSVLRMDSITRVKDYKNIRFLSVNVIEPEARLMTFIQRTGFAVPTLYDFSFLVNRLLTRYAGYYGVLMIKDRKILGAPNVATLSVDNLDRIEQGNWDEQSIEYLPERSRLEFAKDVGRGGKL